MICPYCGATVPDGSTTCRDCGKELGKDSLVKTEILVENLSDAGKTFVFQDEGLGKTQILSEGPEPVEAFLGWLVVTEGPDQWKEFHIPMDMGQLLLGRGRAADIRLNDDALARIHVSLRKKGEGFYLTDLDSDTGTRVNGAPIERVELRDGDVIEMGATTIKFKLL